MQREISTTWLSPLLRYKYRSIVLSELGLIARSAKEEVNVQVSSLQSLPVIRREAFFYTVTISEALKIKGLSKKAAAQINSHLHRLWFTSKYEAVNNAALTIEKKLTNSYTRSSEYHVFVQKAQGLVESFKISPHPKIVNEKVAKPFNYLLNISNGSQRLLKEYRKQFIINQKKQFKYLFDKVESNPLTEAQRNACVIDNDNNLVLAGAGTGKTSTMIGRAAYLVESKQATPDQILMLAFGSKAKDELQDRIKEKLGSNDIKASTFHSLGLDIIGKVEKAKPGVNNLAEDTVLKNKFIDDCLQHLLSDEQYAKKAVRYFENYLYPAKNPFDFKTQGEYIEYIKTNDIRTFSGELVKGYEECLIANFLFTHGIEYQYEAPYKISTKTAIFRQYCPDFYLPEYDIYIEHFGIDRNNRTAPWVDNERYLADIEWKRELHNRNKTLLIETFHYEWVENRLFDSLREQLATNLVTLIPLPEASILDSLRELGRVTVFSKLLGDLLEKVKGTCTTKEQVIEKAKLSAIPDQAMAALDLLLPILDRYEAKLVLDGEVDFNDMINKAIHYVKSGKFEPTWKYILVDEFQDIAGPRAELIMTLRDNSPGCSLFCVGDDWQAIYRFTGSDLRFTTSFADIFGETSTTMLDKTYRFNNSICDTASKFVMENTRQIDKHLVTHHRVNESAISVVRRNNSYDLQHVDEVLSRINHYAKPRATVFVISRYKCMVDYQKLRDIARRYPQLKVSGISMHASKGKEADYVIIIGLQKGQYGFPSEKITHPLVECYLPRLEPHKHAEERRLFYVAITRAKKRVYLVADMTNHSSFMVEILSNKKYDLCLNEFETPLEQSAFMSLSCHQCKTGTLVKRTNDNQQVFFGCSNYPLCTYTEFGCRTCKTVRIKKGRLRVCCSCNDKTPICPKCHGDMKHRKSTNHWGCSNYKGKNAEFSCRHQEKYINLG